MQFTASMRNASLTCHILASVGWAGALGFFLAHSVATVVSTDPRVVRAAAWAMDIAAWYVILPLALASLATGIIHATGTHWGLLRHYWVTFKLVLTVAATAILLLKLGPISALAQAASIDDTLASQGGLKTSLLLHSAGGLIIPMTAGVLAVVKPRGRIAWGGSDAEREEIPAWVKAAIVALSLLVIMFIMMLVIGSHGPNMHR